MVEIYSYCSGKVGYITLSQSHVSYIRTYMKKFIVNKASNVPNYKFEGESLMLYMIQIENKLKD